MGRYWCRLKGDERFFNVEVIFADSPREAAQEFCRMTKPEDETGTVMVGRELKSGWPDDFEHEIDIKGLFGCEKET